MAQLAAMARNSGWLLLGYALRILLTFVMTAWVARYLGPRDFGSLNYAIAFVAVFEHFAYLGLGGVVVKRLVESHAETYEILGTSVALRAVAGAVCAGLATALAWLWTSDSLSMGRSLVAIVSVSLIFRSADIVDFWFQSRLSSKRTVIARTLAGLVIAGVKVLLISVDASTTAFAWVFTAEIALTGCAYVVMYVKSGEDVRRWRFNRRIARQLLALSWPLAVSGFAAKLNLRVDELLLQALRGVEEVGRYSAPVRLLEPTYVLAQVIVVSGFPPLLRLRHDTVAFNRAMQRLFSVLFACALLIALAVSLPAQHIVGIALGPQYSDSAEILAVHAWATVFVFWGEGLSKWILVKDLLWFSLVRHGGGAVLNIGLNLVLIPTHGGLGAAWATLASYAMATIGASVLLPHARQVAPMMVRSLWLGGLWVGRRDNSPRKW